MNEASTGSLQYNADIRAVERRAAASGEDFVLNFSELIGLLRRGFWTIAICGLIGGFVSIYFVLQVTPTFTATSQILLGQQSRADDALGNLFEGLDLDTGEIAGQIAIMKSGVILKGVSEDLQLNRLPEFNVELRAEETPSLPVRAIESLKDGLKAVLGAENEDEAGLLDFQTQGTSETMDPITAAAMVEKVALGDQVNFVGGLASGLSIQQVGKAPLVNISFSSTDRVVAAAVANAVADEYIAVQLEEKFGATRRMAAGLNERITDLRLRLETSERAVIQFRGQMLERDAGGSERLEQQIRELSSRLVEVSTEHAELKAKLNQIDALIADQGILAVAGVLESDLIRQLQLERSAMQLRQDQLRERFGADSPRIGEAAVSIARVEAALGQEVERLREELASQTSVASAREASIRQQLHDLERHYLTLSQEQIRLGQLEREAEASRLIYETFLTTFTKTSEIVGLQEADARVVSYANPPPSPSAPNKKVSVLLGLVAGIFAGMALVFLRAFRDQSIDSADKLRRVLGSVPVVTTMPRIHSLFRRGGPIEAIGDKDILPLEEATRALRNKLMLKQTARGWKVSIISAMPGEGKTTTSLLLAHTIVKAGKSCVVVETDLRRGSINKVLGQAPDTDILDVLSGAVELRNALQRDAKTGAYILPAKPGAADPAGLFLSEQMRDTIRKLEDYFDVIIFDTAPLLSVTDALPIMDLSDDVVLVVRWRRNSVETLRKCLITLHEAGIHLTCAVMTMTRGREFRKYEDYYYTKGPSSSP